MKEKPILFNTEMVQSILDGRKTQTRRVVKPQPNEEGVTYMKSPPALDWEQIYNEEWKPFLFDTEEGERIAIHPPYNPGDILWVRETWCLTQPRDPETYFFSYKAYNQLFPVSDWEASEKYDYSTPDVWKPSIHMPKEAARIWLKVTNVRCERLNHINHEDSIKEGVKRYIPVPLWDGSVIYNNYNLKGDDCPYYHNPIHSFMSLWESFNGLDSWNENPWVWVYDFDVLSTTGKPKEE